MYGKQKNNIKNMHNIYDQIISFKNINLILLDLPQKEKFISGIGVRNSREALIVEWEDQNGVKGYGECSCRPDPYYSYEFTEGAISLIEHFIIPSLSHEQTFGELIGLFEKIRGWNFAKAALEMAALQVIELNTGVSPFGIMTNKPLSKVPVGISIGMYEDFSDIKKIVENSLKLGYKRLKFKISPKVRIDIFDSINAILPDTDTYFSFDANGSLREKDFDVLGYFVNTYDTVIEQPFGTDRFDILLKAKKAFPKLKICFDEEVKSIGDLIKLQKLGVLDEVNLKVGRVGGIMKSIEIMEYCLKHNIPCWIGGMFETGIGRITNLRVASYLPAARAHDLSPSDRYFFEDTIHPPIHMDNGLVEMDSLKDCKIEKKIIDKYTIKSKKFAVKKALAC